MKIVIGIDPGIANTGIGVIKRSTTAYTLLAYQLVKTHAKDSHAERYTAIADAVRTTIETHRPSLLAIEQVYFGKNTTSAMTTAGVIAISLLEAERAGVESLVLTPQEVKAACGLGFRSSKPDMLKCATRLFGVDFNKSEHHAVDAVFAAVAGALLERKV